MQMTRARKKPSKPPGWSEKAVDQVATGGCWSSCGGFYAMIERGEEPWDLLPPDFVIDLSRRLMDPATLRGPDETRSSHCEVDAAWADGARLEVEELIDAGETALGLIRFGGRGKISGA